MKTMLQHLRKLSGWILAVETTKKGLARPLVRKGIPAVLIGSVAFAGLRRHRARRR